MSNAKPSRSRSSSGYSSGRRKGLKAVRCEYCEKKTRRPLYVNVDEGDGCFSTPICQRCLKQRGWVDGQFIDGPV